MSQHRDAQAPALGERAPLRRWRTPTAIVAVSMLGLGIAAVSTWNAAIAIAICALVLAIALMFLLSAELAIVSGLAIALTLWVAVPVLRVPDKRLAIATIGAALAVSALALLQARTLTLSKGTGMLLALIALAIVSTFVNGGGGDAWFRLILMVAVGGTVLALAAQLNDRRPIFLCVAILAIAEAALACAEYLLNLSPIWAGAVLNADGSSRALQSELISGHARAQGTLGHPLPLGFLLVIGLIATVSEQLFGRFRLPVVGLLIAGCVASGSRSALVFAILALCLIPRNGSRSVNLLRALGLAIAAGTLLVTLTFSPDAQDALGVTQLSQSGSVTHRSGALEAGYELLGQPASPLVLGNGWMATPRLYREGLLQSDGLQAVDNQFILTFAELGLAGLAILAAALIYAFQRAGPKVRIMLTAIVGMFLVFDVLAWPSTLAASMAMVGLALAAGRRQRNEGSRPPRLEAVHR